MIVDLEEREERGTFDLKGGGKLHLRLLSADDIKAMRKACVKKVVEYPLLNGKHQRFESSEFDSDLWEAMQWDLTITGWEDLYDKNGKAIPCDRERKVLLMSKVKAFHEAYDAGLAALKAAEKERAEKSEKNSQTGSDTPTQAPDPA